MSRVVTQDDLFQIMDRYEKRIAALEKRLNKISLNYDVTAGYTTDRSFNPSSTTLNEVANVLGSLIDDLR